MATKPRLPGWLGLLMMGGCLALNITTPDTNVVRDYSGFQVFEMTAISPKQQQDFRKLLRHFSSKIDVLVSSSSQNHSSLVMVDPATIQDFTSFLSYHQIPYRVVIDDVKKALEEERTARVKRATEFSYPPSSFDYYTTRFCTYDEILAFLDLIHQSRNKAADTELISIGRSFEGRDLRLIKLSSSGSASTTKPAIFIDAGIHAREWIAPSTAISFIYRLAINPSNDPDILQMLEDFDWYILPLLNPDGYEFSRLSDRMWRKNRNNKYTLGFSCPGVDLNRNFDFHWDPSNGGSSYPCLEVYAGPSPLSEPESKALANFLTQNGSKIKMYLTYHSASQYILYSWGYTTGLPPDNQLLASLGQAGADVMGPYKYDVGSAANLLSAAAGGSDDYAKGVAGVPYSYTIELPPRAVIFTIAPSEIGPVTESSFRGLKVMALTLASRLLAEIPTTKASPPRLAPQNPPITYNNFLDWLQYYFHGTVGRR